MSVFQIKKLLDTFVPLELKDIDKFRLMNRIDTKYLIPLNKVPELIAGMNGEYRILEINNKRSFTYTTTYLDSSDYLFFNEHITGRHIRNKVRYRKYETTGITYLEVKKKINNSRTVKWRIKNESQAGAEPDEESCRFINNLAQIDPLCLRPVLQNRFERITLVGTTVHERITIDHNLSFFDSSGKHTEIKRIAIIEHKKEHFTKYSPLNQILRDHFIHSSGFSKYCYGLAMTKDIPRSKMLNPKIITIKKLENEFGKSDFIG